MELLVTKLVLKSNSFDTHSSFIYESYVPMFKEFHLDHRKLKSKFIRLSNNTCIPINGILLSSKRNKPPKHMSWMNLTNIMLSEKKPETRDHMYDSIDVKCQEKANV